MTIHCVLCGDEADPENPFKSGAIYERNPYTMRMAWMCGFCYEMALEEAGATASTDVNFDSRLDEYMERAAG